MDYVATSIVDSNVNFAKSYTSSYDQAARGHKLQDLVDSKFSGNLNLYHLFIIGSIWLAVSV